MTLKRVLIVLLLAGLLFAYRQWRLAQVPDPSYR